MRSPFLALVLLGCSAPGTGTSTDPSDSGSSGGADASLGGMGGEPVLGLGGEPRAVGGNAIGSGGEPETSGGTSVGGGNSTVGGSSSGVGGSPTCTTVWCIDVDRDGYTDPTTCVPACESPGPLYWSNHGYGDDCYDDNVNAKPGSNFVSSDDRGDGNFDYNCDDDETPEYGLGSCNVVHVENAEGWKNTIPPCGESGDLVTFDTNDVCEVKPAFNKCS